MNFTLQINLTHPFYEASKIYLSRVLQIVRETFHFISPAISTWIPEQVAPNIGPFDAFVSFQYSDQRGKLA
jgi:hypothetical protein